MSGEYGALQNTLIMLASKAAELSNTTYFCGRLFEECKNTYDMSITGGGLSPALRLLGIASSYPNMESSGIGAWLSIMADLQYTTRKEESTLTPLLQLRTTRGPNQRGTCTIPALATFLQ